MNKIVSPVGHDAFLVETRQMGHILRNFITLADQTPSATDLAKQRGNYEI